MGFKLYNSTSSVYALSLPHIIKHLETKDRVSRVSNLYYAVLELSRLLQLSNQDWGVGTVQPGSVLETTCLGSENLARF